MKKILGIIMGTFLLLGCSPSRSQMQSSIDDLSTQLDASEASLEEKEEERERQVEILCAIVGELVNDRMIEYIGNKTFRMPDGSTIVMEEMESECLKIVDSYEKVIMERFLESQ